METPQKILLISSLVGILLLLFLSKTMEPEVQNISNLSINKSFLGKNSEIKIIANITHQTDIKNSSLTILNLEDSTGKITGIINTKKIIIFNLTKTYEITGKLTEYENQTEISINRITPIAL